MINFKPLADRIVIEPAQPEEKTLSGIYIPETAQERPLRGVVVVVGDKINFVKVGDTVVYGQYSGTEKEIEGISCLMMKEDDIYAIFNLETGDLTPVLNRVLLEPIVENTSTIKTIGEDGQTVELITSHKDLVDNKLLKGTVIGIGSQCETEIKIGDIVVYSKMSGNKILIEGKNYLQIREYELHGIWEETGE